MKKITLMMAFAMFTLVGWQANAQNGGDTCDLAVAVTPGTYSDAAITNTAGGANTAGAVNAVWYSYTADADGTIDINSCMSDPAGVDTRLRVYNGDCTALTQIAADDDGCDAPNGFGSSVSEVPVVNGVTYYIEWDDRWETDPFDWSLTYNPPPACPDVENITATGNMDGSVNLDWDDAAGAVGYNYEIQPQGTAQGTAGALVMDTTATSDAVVAAGVLTSGTTYTIYVVSDCDAGAIGDYQSIDYLFVIPASNDNCDSIIDLDDETSPLNGNTVDATNDFNQDCLTNPGAPDVIYSITVPDTFILTFEQLSNNYDSKVRLAYGDTCPGDMLIVCYDDPDTAAQEWVNTTGAEQEVYITISAFSIGSGVFTLEYLVSPPPTCADIENFAFVSATDTTADFSWDDNAEAVNGFTINVYNAGDDITDPAVTPVATTMAAAGETMATVTGLTETTSYDAYIQGDCDAGGLSAMSMVTFGTSPAPPVCGGKFYDTGGPDGDFMNNENYQVVISPDNVGDVVTASFVFVDNAGGAFDTLSVDIGDGNFVVVPDVDMGDPPVEYTSIAADGSLIFNFVSSAVVPNPGWDADIICGPPPTCPDPQNFAVSNITDMSADFTWSEVAEAADGYTLSVFLAGDDPMVDPAVGGTPLMVASGTLMATVTGLDEDTDYTAYLIANCAPDDISNSEIVNFSTQLSPGPNATCETALVIDPGMYIGQIVDANPGTNNGDSLWYSFTPTEDGTITITSCFGDDNDDTRVFLSEGPCDALVPVADDDDGCDDPNTFSSLITGIPVVTGTEYLIQWDDRWSTTEFDWELVFEGLPCTAPTNITVSNETSTGADVSWDAAPTAVQGYLVQVFASGDTTTALYEELLPPSATSTTVDTGLMDGSAYDVYVSSLCDLGADPQDIAISDPVPFNTILGIESSSLVSYVIFPNPANNEINLRAAHSIVNIAVFNIIGQEVLSNKGGDADVTLDISELQSGTYFVKATVNDIEVVERLIKK